MPICAVPRCNWKGFLPACNLTRRTNVLSKMVLFLALKLIISKMGLTDAAFFLSFSFFNSSTNALLISMPITVNYTLKSCHKAWFTNAPEKGGGIDCKRPPGFAAFGTGGRGGDRMPLTVRRLLVSGAAMSRFVQTNTFFQWKLWRCLQANSEHAVASRKRPCVHTSVCLPLQRN